MTIRYKLGNLLDADTEALVNTVNTVGVMGKGIALMFKEAFPENTRAYGDACKKKEVELGKMFVTERFFPLRPTMGHQFSDKRTLAVPQSDGMDC